MAEEIRFKAIYDDSDINRALNGIVSSTEAANDAAREYGQVTTQAFNSAAKSAEKATLATVNNSKAIAGNASRINELSKLVIALKAQLLQLQQGYDAFADKGSAGAKRVQDQMKKVSAEIQKTESSIKDLTESNKKMADTGNLSSAALDKTSTNAKRAAGDLDAVTKNTGGLSNLFRVLTNRGGELIERLGGGGQAAQFFGNQLKGAATGAIGLAGGVTLIIGAVIALLALPVILFFKKTQEGAELAEIKLNQLAASFKVVTDRAATFGGNIVAYLSGQKSFTDVIASGVVALIGLGGALNDAAKEAESYTIILQNFRKAQLDFQSDEIKAEARAKSLRLAVDDTTKSIGQRTSALQRAGAIESDLDAKRIKSAQKQLEFARKDATTGDGLLVRNEKLVAAEKALSDAITTAEERKAQDKQTLISLREESRRAAEEERKALEALRGEYDRLLKQIQALELEQLSPSDRLRKEQEIAIQEINKFEAELKKAYAERKQVYDAADEFDRLRVLTNTKYEKAISDVTLEEIGKRLAAEEQALKQRQSDEDAFNALQLQVLEKQKAIELARLENIDDSGKAEAEAIQEKEEAKLRIELDYAIRRKQVLESQYGTDSLEVQLINEQIRNIELALDDVKNVKLGGFDKLKERILSALKIDEQDAQFLGQVAGGALDAYLQFLDATTEAQLSVQDTIIEKTEERINKTQELLDIELERQRQGYANSVDALRQTLDQQNKERDQAESKRNAIARKAAKQRAAISAAEQLAETGLLAVRVFSEAVKATGLYGIVLGAAGLALILARVAAVRAQIKAANTDTGFKDGTPFVEGPGGPKSDSISARLSRGERVVPADINDRMGGRRLTNEELFKYYELGRRVAQRKEIAIPVAATSARASKDRAAMEVAVMQSAYAQASDKAADKMIAYWKTRPVEKVVGGQKVIEWQEGSGVRRQRIKNIDKNK